MFHCAVRKHLASQSLNLYYSVIEIYYIMSSIIGKQEPAYTYHSDIFLKFKWSSDMIHVGEIMTVPKPPEGSSYIDEVVGESS